MAFCGVAPGLFSNTCRNPIFVEDAGNLTKRKSSLRRAAFLIVCVLQLLDVGSAALMLDIVEVLEVGLTLMVIFENGSCLNALHAILNKVGCHLVEDKCCNALILIVWAHGNQQ